MSALRPRRPSHHLLPLICSLAVASPAPAAAAVPPVRDAATMIDGADFDSEEPVLSPWQRWTITTLKVAVTIGTIAGIVHGLRLARQRWLPPGRAAALPDRYERRSQPHSLALEDVPIAWMGPPPRNYTRAYSID